MKIITLDISKNYAYVVTKNKYIKQKQYLFLTVNHTLTF